MTRRPHFSTLIAAAGSLALAGCASLAPGGAKHPPLSAAHAASAGASAPAKGQARPPAPGQPQPFDTVIKDAKKIDGLFTLWQKDEKVWIELTPDDFGKPLFLSPKLSQGVGEPRLYGGLMLYGQWGGPQLVEFRRVHNQVQMVALNTEFVARAGTPEARAVASAYSPSLLGSTAVASQPHAERKSILVEANPLFLSDMQGLAMVLQRQYRQNYGFDVRHSSLASVRGRADAVMFEVSAHYLAPSLAMPPTGAAPAGAPVPSTPSTLPDPRSLFLGVHYSLSRLPAQPMAARPADPRVGHFITTVSDFSDDLARSPRRRFVNRWRLEKKDPSAELSEPVKPITFWLDRGVPVKYRDAITRGVLEWNKAFERIGFKDALVVKVQPDDADFDTLDVGVASIRWMTNAKASFGAIGPSHVDPRSGEILDADIGMESLSSRSLRALRSQIIASPTREWSSLMQLDAAHEPAADGAHDRLAPGHAHEHCEHADALAEQTAFALDVLTARGEIAPDSPQAEQFVLNYLTDTTMHEVGHTLGLRHNFRSSRVYSDSQLSDPDFVRSNGLAGSVMEYAAINLARPGSPEVPAWQKTLGPYDYWAIEYAYKPMPPGTTPEQEQQALQRIAARSSEPALAYGTDEDNYLGVDPESLHFDLGDDPVAFAHKRLDIVADLLRRQSARALPADGDYAVLRRSVGYALRDAARAAGIAARQIGGVRTLRDHPGSQRDPLSPVPAARQRAALDMLSRRVLAADAFRLPPELLRRMAPDYAERQEAIYAGQTNVSTDFSLAGAVLDMQRALLAQLMSDKVAQRLLDSADKAQDPADALGLSELYERLASVVWSDLGAGRDIPSLRRDLQREYVDRVVGVLIRPSSLSRADARSLMRSGARQLLARIDASIARKGLSPEARAHLEDAAQSLRQALAASLQRAGA